MQKSNKELIILYTRFFYIIGLILYSTSRFLQNSLILELNSDARSFVRIFALIFMLPKLLIQKYSKKDFIIIVPLLLLFILFIYFGGDRNTILLPVILIGLKEMDLKKIIKYMFYINSFLLILHLFAFVIYYYTSLYSVEKIFVFTYSWYCKEKSLLYGNVNMYAFRYICTLMQYMYITNRESGRIIKSIIISVLSLFVFLITNSWTMFFISIMLVFYMLTEKILLKIGHYRSIKLLCLLLCILITIVFVKIGNTDTSLAIYLNKIFTNRPYYISEICKTYGFSMLPNVDSFNSIWKDFGKYSVIVPDNSYISIFIKWGILLSLIMFILCLYLCVYQKNDLITDYLILTMFVLFIVEYVSFEITMYIVPMLVINNYFNKDIQI